jgi:hypothetical protein
LTNPERVSVDLNVIQQLRELHPVADPIDATILPPAKSMDRPIRFKPEIVCRNLKKMRKGTSPGFSSLRAENLLNLVGNYPTDNRGYNLLDDLTLFLDLIANGLIYIGNIVKL